MFRLEERLRQYCHYHYQHKYEETETSMALKVGGILLEPTITFSVPMLEKSHVLISG